MNRYSGRRGFTCDARITLAYAAGASDFCSAGVTSRAPAF